jgi:hypothetical protein
MGDMYLYDGPVLEFDRVIADRWVSKTFAPSEKKARSNLAYQFKKQFNRASSAKITLPGKIVCSGREERIS